MSRHHQWSPPQRVKLYIARMRSGASIRTQSFWSRVTFTAPGLLRRSLHTLLFWLRIAQGDQKKQHCLFSSLVESFMFFAVLNVQIGTRNWRKDRFVAKKRQILTGWRNSVGTRSSAECNWQGLPWCDHRGADFEHMSCIFISHQPWQCQTTITSFSESGCWAWPVCSTTTPEAGPPETKFRMDRLPERRWVVSLLFRGLLLKTWCLHVQCWTNGQF